MGEHPSRTRRRLVPDEAQVQIILGSLLGDGRIEGHAGERRLCVSELAHRAGYVRWKYQHLAALADGPPAVSDGRVSFTTISHPFFDEVSALIHESPSRLSPLIGPLGHAVRMTDARPSSGLAESACADAIELIRE